MEDKGGVRFTNVSYTPPSSRAAAGPSVRPILKGICASVEPGNTLALLGRSGSGKTTLLRTVNGLVLPTSGTVEVLGRTLSSTTDSGELRQLRRSIGYVIQDTGLFPHMTIARNVALPLEVAGTPRDQRDARAAELLEVVGLPAAEYAERYPHELSGGQRQRVGLARALSTSPKLLLFDEPFGALDPLTRAEMQTMLRDLLEQFGTTALMVTHDLDEAIFLADRVLFLESGSVFADLPSAEVMHSKHPGVVEYVRAVHRVSSAQVVQP